MQDAPTSIFLAPSAGDAVRVRLDERMVEALRDEHEDYPTATNHPLADRVQQLLAEGTRTLDAEVVRAPGTEMELGGKTVRVCGEFDMIRVRCPQLTGDEHTTAVFCAGDCDLQAP